MFAAFALHYIALPFDTNNDEGQVLHGLERNSMLSVFFLLWAATFFLLQRKCDAPSCVFMTILVVFSNVVVLLVAIRMFVKHFMIRTKLSEHVTKAARKVLSKSKKKNVLNSMKSNPLRSNPLNGKNSKTNPMHGKKKKKGGRGKLDVPMLASRNRSTGGGGEMKNTTQVQKVRDEEDEEEDEDENEMTMETETETETELKYFVHPKSGKEYYIDPATGSTKWRKEKASPTTTKESQVIKYIVDPNTGNEYYIDPVTGVAKWREKKPLPRQSRVGEMLEGMASFGIDYLVDPASGNEYYIDPVTGDAKWKEGTKWD
jgi:hypothetical protein